MLALQSPSAPRKVLFILGIGRSGSTMLDLMLGSHSEGFSLGEISKVPMILQRDGSPKAFCRGSTFWQDTFTPAELSQLAKGLSGHRLRPYLPMRVERKLRELLGTDAIFNPYTLLFNKLQKTFLVDSSKYAFWVKQRLTAREFRSGALVPYTIHLIRDGRAVLNSYLRAFPNRTAEQISRKWLENLQQSEAIYQSTPPDYRLRVRYEELVTAPEQTLKAICDRLKIVYEPAMLTYWEGNHHPIAGSRSAKAMLARHRDQPLAQGIMAAHGDYYQTLGLDIKLDQRWRKELSAENLAQFHAIVQDANRPFEWNEA